MASLNVKVSDKFKAKLEEVAKGMGRTKSDLVREALESYCLDTLPEDDWRTLIWNFFDISMTRVDYAYNRSDNAAQFFGFISQWMKESKLHLTMTYDEIIIVLTSKNGIQHTTRHDRNAPKEKIISDIVHELEASFTEATLEDI